MTSFDTNGSGMTSLRTRKRLVESLKNAGIGNEYVLEALINTPRHLFIDEAMAHHAYEDIALPIGFGQTISQPYIVAKMTEALMGGNSKLDKVLEIGTGSGYQAAVLASLVSRVYSIERIKDLYELSKKRFRQLRLNNIYSRYDDGSLGWAEHAPYNGIIVTCATKEIPKALLEQLAIGGRLVIPVEAENLTQQLRIVTRENNDYNTTYLDLVRFVPLLLGRE